MIRANVLDPSINKRISVSGITKTRLFALTRQDKNCCSSMCTPVLMNVPFSFAVDLGEVFDLDIARSVLGSCDFFRFWYSPDLSSWTELWPHSCTECSRTSSIEDCEFIDASHSINDATRSVSYEYTVLTASATQIEADVFQLFTWVEPDWLDVKWTPFFRFQGLGYTARIQVANNDSIAHTVLLSLRADGDPVSRSTVLRFDPTLVRHCANDNGSSCLAGNTRYNTSNCRFDCPDFQMDSLTLSLSASETRQVEVLTSSADFEQNPVILEVEV